SRPRASSAAVSPERTSPLPAVARPGAETALTATRSPSVTIVSSPLRTTTAPLQAAASRAAARRRAPISAESRSSRRPSSPACGVGIGGAGRGGGGGEAGRPAAATPRGPRAPRRPPRGGPKKFVGGADPGAEHAGGG